MWCPAAIRRTGCRVRLADRALTQTNPLLGVAAQLLDTGRRASHRQ